LIYIYIPQLKIFLGL